MELVWGSTVTTSCSLVPTGLLRRGPPLAGLGAGRAGGGGPGAGGAGGLEELADVVRDRLGVGVREAEGFGLDLDPRGHVEDVDEPLHPLGEADVALEDQLVGVAIDVEGGVARDGALEAIEDVARAGVGQAEHLDDDVAVLGKPHHIDFGPEHDRRLQLLHVGQLLDHDDVVGLDDADAVEAERLEDQVEGAIGADRLVVDDGDLHRRDLGEAKHHHLAGPFDDVGDHRLDPLVAEAEHDGLPVGGASLGASGRRGVLADAALEDERLVRRSLLDGAGGGRSRDRRGQREGGRGGGEVAWNHREAAPGPRRTPCDGDEGGERESVPDIAEATAAASAQSPRRRRASSHSNSCRSRSRLWSSRRRPRARATWLNAARTSSRLIPSISS
jgi:hypothetical protein